LRTAIRRRVGEAVFLQRCQVYKKRNIADHLPKERKTNVRRKPQNAYSMADYEDAKRALDRSQHELMHLNPSAARSLEEGLKKRSAFTRFESPDQLRRTLCCANVIESAFSIVETLCRKVKRWREGDQIERWVRAGLLVAEQQFR
jgi:putative transposase